LYYTTDEKWVRSFVLNENNTRILVALVFCVKFQFREEGREEVLFFQVDTRESYSIGSYPGSSRIEPESEEISHPSLGNLAAVDGEAGDVDFIFAEEK